MKICLTANSGGHLNQLLQLKSFYKKRDHFFITDRNSLSEELAKSERVYFIEKFVFKEIILKRQFLKPFKNLMQAVLIFIKERPDAIITTGAGTAFGPWVLGLLFKKTVFIESIARTNGPSVFGKLFGRRADVVFVQWEHMLKFYPKGLYSGLIFSFDEIRTHKKNSIKNIFITAGTYRLQFNRVLKEMDDLLENGRLSYNVTAQIGASDYKPKNFSYFDYCGQHRLHEIINDSDLVICQGGSGSLMDSLLRGKKVIGVPRLVAYKEYFDDHQIQLVGELEKMGLILAVYEIKDLREIIKKTKDFIPDFNGIGNSKMNNDLENFFNAHFG